jgi:hypothetical protein
MRHCGTFYSLGIRHTLKKWVLRCRRHSIRRHSRCVFAIINCSHDRPNNDVQTSLSASMTFFGPQTGAQPWIDQMLALGPTRFQNTSLPWSSASAAASFGAATNACRKGQYNSHPTVGANQTSPESYVSVLKQYMDTMRTRPWYVTTQQPDTVNLR